MKIKYSVDELKKLKREDLYQIAQDLKITGRSKMKKAGLVDALKPFATKAPVSEKATPKNTKAASIKNSKTPEPEKKSAVQKKNKDSKDAAKTKNANKAKSKKVRAGKDKKSTKKNNNELSQNECVHSDAAVKILNRSFGKQKVDKNTRNKVGAVVKPVAIPLEVPKKTENDKVSKRAEEIEQKRQQKHSSLKTTMEIPVFSVPSPESAVPIVEEDLTGDLPSDYNETRIVVQIRDPHWAHAYWQIPRSELKRLELDVGIFEFAHSHFVLRIHNVTDGFTQEFELSENARSHYFFLEKANTIYQAELGLQSPTEGYSFVALSNLIQTPADKVASVWAVPVGSLPRASGNDDARIAGHEMPCPPSFESSETKGPAEITEPNLVFNSSKFSDNSEEEAGKMSGAGFLPDKESANHEKIQEVIPESSPSSFMPGSFAMPLSVSSPDSFSKNPDMEKEKGQVQNPDIFLQARVEVIVYGKTNPGNDLTFNGHKIALDTEGCFSLRLQMPENEQRDIKIEARKPQTKLKRDYQAAIKLDVF
jgi:hypothetical protein